MPTGRGIAGLPGLRAMYCWNTSKIRTTIHGSLLTSAVREHEKQLSRTVIPRAEHPRGQIAAWDHYTDIRDDGPVRLRLIVAISNKLRTFQHD